MLDSRPSSYRGNKEEKPVSLSSVNEKKRERERKSRKERRTVLANEEGRIWCLPPPKVLYLKQKEQKEQRERKRERVAIYTPVPLNSDPFILSHGR